MNALYLLFALLLSLSAYSTVDILKLHQHIKETHTKPLEYTKSKVLLFNYVDNFGGIVCSVYTPSECKSFKNLNNTSQLKNGGFKFNVEHTWPQSKGADVFPAQGDLHHLYPTSKESNSKRANYPFGSVFESSWEKQGSLFGIDSQFRTCFEPVSTHKGNVARAMFYFSIRYKKSLTLKQEELFREWNQLDPVDEQERLRNDRVEKLQGNRNPFIDYKGLVDQIEHFQF